MRLIDEQARDRYECMLRKRESLIVTLQYPDGHRRENVDISVLSYDGRQNLEKAGIEIIVQE